MKARTKREIRQRNKSLAETYADANHLTQNTKHPHFDVIKEEFEVYGDDGYSWSLEQSLLSDYDSEIPFIVTVNDFLNHIRFAQHAVQHQRVDGSGGVTEL